MQRKFSFIPVTCAHLNRGFLSFALAQPVACCDKTAQGFNYLQHPTCLRMWPLFCLLKNNLNDTYLLCGHIGSLLHFVRSYPLDLMWFHWAHFLRTYCSGSTELSLYSTFSTGDPSDMVWLMLSIIKVSWRKTLRLIVILKTLNKGEGGPVYEVYQRKGQDVPVYSNLKLVFFKP